MPENATITVVDAALAAIQDMGVQVYDETNTTLIGSGVTDGAGQIVFLLQEADANNSGRHQLRFHGDHLRASVTSPQPIKVVVPPPNNTWQFTADTFVVPTSPNPHRCRCWAFFTDAGGRPLRGHYIRIAATQNPAVIHTVPHGYSQETLHLTTDAQGYVQVDLVRLGEYTVTMSGYLDVVTDITVPALGAANLVDILFPTPSTVTFVPPGPSVVAVGATATFVPTVGMLDGSTLTLATTPPATDYVTFTSSNPAVMTVSAASPNVVVTGVAAGGANLMAIVNTDGVMPRRPPALFIVTPVVVTVP